MENKGKKVQSVEKAMRLLDCFWSERRDFSLAELSVKTGWAKSTIHALLSSMMENDTIEQDRETGRYRLGYHTFELGCVAQERWEVLPIAAHYMRRIADRTGESLYLGMRCGDEILLIENSEGFHNFKVASPLGGRMPMYACSQGKMLLSLMDPEELEQYLQRVEFKRYTPYTITDPEQLKTELEKIRQQGYALEYGELQTGLKAVAAPIYDENGACDYSISAVTIARSEVAGERFQKLRQIVVKAAEEISGEMKYPLSWRE